MSKKIRIVVCGAAGRMGRRVAALAAEDGRFQVAALIGRCATQDCLAPDALPRALSEADALIDFTAPEAAVRFVQAAAQARKPAVVGTTGLSAVEQAQIKACSRRIPVFMTPNFSPGVHVLGALARQAAALLKEYEASLSEIHHSLKKDAPSGTALRLARIVVAARGGVEPAIVSQRIGDIAGEHTLTLAGPCERIELTHRAHCRDVFARGALRASLWLAGRKPGLYDMPDLLAGKP